MTVQSRKFGFNTIIYSLLFLFSLTGCLPKEGPSPPYYAHIKTFPYSIYTNQVYYSLAKDTVVSHNSLGDWDLGFEASEEGSHIIVNSGDLLAVTNLGSVDIHLVNPSVAGAKWVYDASDGNFDSLAINQWVDVSTIPYLYSNDLYILARQDDQGIYVAYRKFKCVELTKDYYKILTGLMDQPIPDTVIVTKDPSVNFVCLSLRSGNSIVPIEPSKEDWDLLFTRYGTILFTDAGVPTPYSVNGVFINPNKVRVAKDNISDFLTVDSTYLSNYSFSSKWDIIGYDWKEVTINEAANTALYKPDPKKIYIIQDTRGDYYKLRFILYYKSGLPGYPGFEYLPVQ